ncbi:MAG TPA: Gfo/Idh/MocA family oxidoreductase [Sedimentisphaerales bacterium]|nr:Gfo/Idh/MocA family oxidoreductase [Sedimentisphaerales bacterium]
MKKWNFGIIGAGVIGDFHARAIGDMGNGNLYAVCDSNINRAEEFAKKYNCKAFGSYQEMLKEKDIDVVTIATPSGLHMEPTVAAAEANKHVICEKPLDVTVERIDQMIEAHEKAGTKLGAIFQARFADSLVPLRNAIKNVRFGTITYAGVSVPWWRTQEYYSDTWHGTWELDGGGALMNQSIHAIDMLCEMMPAKVESVLAFSSKIGHEGIETEDTSVAALKFNNGALGVIYGSTASFPGRSRRFEMTGTKGSVVYEGDRIIFWQFENELPEDENIRKQFGGEKRADGSSDPKAFSHALHTRNFSEFIKSIETGGSFCLNPQEARKSVALIRKIYKSSMENEQI